MIVSGFSDAIFCATVSYAATVAAIPRSSPRPTSGMMSGGCGTINAPVIPISFSSAPCSYRSFPLRDTVGYTLPHLCDRFLIFRACCRRETAQQLFLIPVVLIERLHLLEHRRTEFALFNLRVFFDRCEHFRNR